MEMPYQHRLVHASELRRTKALKLHLRQPKSCSVKVGYVSHSSILRMRWYVHAMLEVRGEMVRRVEKFKFWLGTKKTKIEKKK